MVGATEGEPDRFRSEVRGAPSSSSSSSCIASFSGSWEGAPDGNISLLGDRGAEVVPQLDMDPLGEARLEKMLLAEKKEGRNVGGLPPPPPGFDAPTGLEGAAFAESEDGTTGSKPTLRAGAVRCCWR